MDKGEEIKKIAERLDELTNGQSAVFALIEEGKVLISTPSKLRSNEGYTLPLGLSKALIGDSRLTNDLIIMLTSAIGSLDCDGVQKFTNLIEAAHNELFHGNDNTHIPRSPFEA